GNYREPHNKTYLVINESPIPMVDTDYLTASLSPQIYKLPEPFRLLKATRLRYKLETSAPVTVKIYDSSGNLVKTQLDGISKPAGDYVDIFWDGTNEFGDYITDGVYLCRVTADGRTNVVKIIILPES
ncbi:MAG: T9SS type A sorting domain-containing protein, partial [candidate division KSB1 bacterium]|nr:T9SS type A sorting domain-containing protein [candidate division KSB1 bacterium]